MNKVKIVAAILDTAQLTLYKENGDTIVIKQGDKRVQRIVNEATDPLTRQGWAEVDIGHPELDQNAYKDFEQSSSGGVKFFRVAKSWIKGLFSTETETVEYHDYLKPVSLGTVPKVRDATANVKPTMEEATKQIMDNAQSVSDPEYQSSDTTEEHTIIAEVTEPVTGKKTLVPGAENLQNQFAAATKLGSTQGVEKFLSRIAAVIEDRGHTVQELLSFMSRGDLPIADDGSILAYKVLQTNARPGALPGTMVDCYSKQVVQRVGSLVRQLKVDASRRTECSTGLHIARRGYLRSFSGDVIVLVKVAPEDVIAVPVGEPNKMRAQGYHIVSRVPSKEHAELRSGRPIAGSESLKLLNMAIKGEHIGIIETVTIGGPKGTETVVTPAQLKEDELARAPRVTKEHTPATPISTETPAERVKETAPVVDVKVTANKAVAAKTETRGERIDRLIGIVRGNAKLPERTAAAQELSDIKSGAKKSWDSLGITSSTVATIQQLLGTETKKSDPIPPLKVEEPKTEPVKKAPKVETEAEAATRDRATKKAKAPAKPKGEPKVTEAQLLAQAKRMIEDTLANTSFSRNQKAASLVSIMTNATFIRPVQKLAFQTLIDFKRKAKVGWGQLGVDNFDALQAKFEGK